MKIHIEYDDFGEYIEVLEDDQAGCFCVCPRKSMRGGSTAREKTNEIFILAGSNM